MAYIDDEIQSVQSSLEYLLSQPISGITSRDQIINPALLVNPDNYKKTRAGQARYKADLAAAQQYMQQQEAAYNDWYNSAEQQAIRERESGLNPDITEYDSAPASQTAGSSINPMDSIPTIGEVVANAIGSITSVVTSLSSVSSLATAFADIGLTNASTEGQELANIDSLKTRMAGDISGLLANAQDMHLASGSTDPFDMAAWFANDANFAGLKDVYGGFGSYGAALALARQQSLKYHSDASKIQKDAAQNDWDFSNIIADPRFSTSQKLTAIQVRPFMKASQDLEQATIAFQTTLANWNNDYQKGLDVDAAVDASNAQFESTAEKSEYERQYYGNSDGALVAGFEQFMRQAQQTAGKLEMSINSGYQKMYDSDPNGIGGTKAAYLYGSHGGASWTEAYYTNAYDSFVQMIEADETIKMAIATNSDLAEKLKAIDPLMKQVTKADKFTAQFIGMSRAGATNFKKRIHDYINSLQVVADSL